MEAHQPLTFVQAASLDCLQEEKLLGVRHSSRPRAPPHQPLPPPHSVSLPPLLPSPGRPTPPSLKRLSPDELASQHERSLCFNCDKKYHRGHGCASRVFLLITDDEDTTLPNIVPYDPPLDPPDNIDPCQAQISFNSLAGHLAPEMLHLLGLIADHQVVVLVDGGSMHNFIQQLLVTLLRLPCCETNPLRVMVENGQHLYCTCICEAIPIDIQST